AAHLLCHHTQARLRRLRAGSPAARAPWPTGVHARSAFRHARRWLPGGVPFAHRPAARVVLACVASDYRRADPAWGGCSPARQSASAAHGDLDTRGVACRWRYDYWRATGARNHRDACRTDRNARREAGGAARLVTAQVALFPVLAGGDRARDFHASGSSARGATGAGDGEGATG